MSRKSLGSFEQSPSGNTIYTQCDTIEDATSVNWSPNGRFLLLGTRSGRVHVLDDQGGRYWQHQSHQRPVLNASWSCDGNLISSYSADGKCSICCIAEKQCLAELKDTCAWFDHVAWSPWQPLILTASYNLIQLWTASGRLVEVYDSHKFPVTDLVWNPCQQDLFASCAADGIKIWSLALKRPIQTLSCPGYPQHLSFNRAGTILAFACADKSVRAWTPESGSLLETHAGIEELSGLDWSWGGQWLSICGEYLAYLCKFGDVSPRASAAKPLSGCFGKLSHLQFHAYEHLLAGANDEGFVQVWRTDRQERFLPVSTCYFGTPVTGIAWNPLARKLAIAYGGRNLQIWTSEFRDPDRVN